MSAMSELAAAGMTWVPEQGELVARHPFGAACDATPWRVHAYRANRGLFRPIHPDYGVYVDAYPREIVRLGRPEALDTAAAIAPLHLWDREELQTFLGLPAGTPCDGCGRPRTD